MQSLASTLSVARTHLPRALVSADAFARACAAIEHLPAAVTKGVYFECRLHDRSPQVDLVVAVHERGAAILAEHRPHVASPRARETRWWGRLLAFCRTWTDPSSTLGSLFDHIWLEYDVDRHSTGGRNTPSASVPGVFVSFREPRPGRDSTTTLYAGAVKVIEALAGRTISTPVAAGLRTCFDRLPPAAGVHHIGLLTQREAPTMRVCIAKLPPADVGPYITATAAANPADIDAVTRLAACRVGPERELCVPMLHLDIDARDGFLPRLGMERPFARRGQPSGFIGPAERALLDRLTARGLCASAKRDAILTWPGQSISVMPHELWWSRIDRRVNHVKLVAEPGAEIEVKGYLFMSYRCHGRPERPADGAVLDG